MTPFRTPHLLSNPRARTFTIVAVSIPAIFAIRAMSTTTPSPKSSPNNNPAAFPTKAYNPPPPSTPFPYTPRDFLRADESPDPSFYSSPRFVTHIDDNAIQLLRQYYSSVLPRQGRILDLCSSWISHFPKSLEESALTGKKGLREGKKVEEGEALEVIGLGMNDAELRKNPILSRTVLQDLNIEPTIPADLKPLQATVCVVSIDYLTKPLEVLTSLRRMTVAGGTVHLIISNRCFPTKAVGRWLRISERERLKMVGDYLHYSGWKGIEIVEVCDGRESAPGFMGMLGGGVDPLWVVRGSNPVKGEDGGLEDGDQGGKSEL